MEVTAQRSKATRDTTRCLVCHRVICTDSVKEFVYKDDNLLGAIHEACYDSLLSANAGIE